MIVSETLVDILQDYEDVGTCQNYQFSEKKVTGGSVSKNGHRAGIIARDHITAVAMLTGGKVQTDHQPEDGQGAWDHDSTDRSLSGDHGDPVASR